MKLYNFFRSGTSHRLRIALNLKGITSEYLPIDLRAEQHLQAAFKHINPQGFVPVLETDDGDVLIQSPAIIEWLEEVYPTPALLPKDPIARAKVRALAAIIGCDIHPINNRRILEYLKLEFQTDQSTLDAWANTWISEGFAAYETLLKADTQRQKFSFGNQPSLADVYLIPQVASARRFHVSMTSFPCISAIEQACNALDAFRKAAPNNQKDAV